MEQFMPLSLFVLTSVRLRFKWFVQPKLYQEISFSHAFMSSSPVKRLVAGKRLVQHGFGFECLGCWPCRTAKVASSSLAIPSKSLEQLVTLMIWKKCWPQTEFCSFCFGTFQKRRDKDWAQQTFLQSVLWVHGLHSCPILCPNVQTWCFD